MKLGIQNIFIAVISVILMSCASTGTKGGDSVAIPSELPNTIALEHEEIIAVDIVSLLVQLPQSSPFYTTVQFSTPKNTFGNEILEAMTASGYGIQMVNEDQGQNYVNYRMSGSQNASTNGNVDVSVSINQLEIKRTYAIRQGELVPSSDFEVHGAKPSNVIINSDLFRTYKRSYEIPNTVLFFRNDGSTAAVYVSNRNAKSGRGNSGERVDVGLALIKSRAAIFTLDRIRSDNSLNYHTDAFRNHKILKIRFQGKDLTLGKRNKAALASVIKGINQNKDVLLISGCSHGQSLLWDGTEVESLARQQRIKEEILSYGINSSNVRENGCFPTEYTDDLVPGMVIIAHKKPISNIL